VQIGIPGTMDIRRFCVFLVAPVAASWCFRSLIRSFSRGDSKEGQIAITKLAKPCNAILMLTFYRGVCWRWSSLTTLNYPLGCLFTAQMTQRSCQVEYSQQITKLRVPGYEFDCFRQTKG